MSSQKVSFVCLHGSAKSLIAAKYFNRLANERNLPLRATTSGPEPTLIAAENLSDTSLIVSFACDAGRRLAPSKPEERWDECPTVSDDFDVAWTFITSRVDKLVSCLSAQ